MALPPSKRVELGALYPVWGQNIYPQWSGTRPDKQRTPNCVGENVSPPLAWSGVPNGTKSFALLLFDPEGRAPAGVSHMVLYGIPADVKGFAEGELSKESPKFVGGKNLMGTGLYFGPGTPPNTDWHHYTWTL